MKRREFGKSVLTGAVASSTLGAQSTPSARKNTFMHVGGDYHSVAGEAGMTSRQNLEYNLRHGVKHLTISGLRPSRDGGWDLDQMKRMRDDCEKYGVVLEAIRMDPDYITYRKGPERDRVLENVAGNIQKAAQVGVKIITYHWTVIPIRRNTQTPGRGGVTYAGFKLEQNWKELSAGELGRCLPMTIGNALAIFSRDWYL